MYKSSEVADRLREVAKLRKVPMKEALEDAGLSFNIMTNMRKSMPNATTLAKLADRLDCSVDYLLGRSPHVQTPGMEKPVVGPTQNAAEMLALYVQLSERDQVLLIGRLQAMVEQQEGGEKDVAPSQEDKRNSSGSSPARAG